MFFFESNEICWNLMGTTSTETEWKLSKYSSENPVSQMHPCISMVSSTDKEIWITEVRIQPSLRISHGDKIEVRVTCVNPKSWMTEKPDQTQYSRSPQD